MPVFYQYKAIIDLIVNTIIMHNLVIVKYLQEIILKNNLKGRSAYDRFFPRTFVIVFSSMGMKKPSAIWYGKSGGIPNEGCVKM